MKALKSCAAISALLLLVGLCVYLPYLFSESRHKEARYYQKLEEGSVQCRMCPRNCIIPSGRRGFCGIRENRSGVLYTLSYAKAVSAHPYDPIEKKPLFHFLPGEYTFSIATAGCNLKCKFCQNWQISQKLPEEIDYSYIDPERLVEAVKESGRRIIAYTYTEPTVFYEYMLETAKLARKAGIKNVMHSNGYINEEPLRELCKYLDAANIDLKGFTEGYYSDMAEGTLAPVLSSLKILKDEGVHLEITNLIVPGFNDEAQDIRRMCEWIKESLGADTPVHFSRFSPMYKLVSINMTPAETLEKARNIAMECGLKYVYIGNLPGNPAESTYCSNCGRLIIGRRGFIVYENNLEGARCGFCKEEVEGVWQ